MAGLFRGSRAEPGTLVRTGGCRVRPHDDRRTPEHDRRGNQAAHLRRSCNGGLSKGSRAHGEAVARRFLGLRSHFRRRRTARPWITQLEQQQRDLLGGVVSVCLPRQPGSSGALDSSADSRRRDRDTRRIWSPWLPMQLCRPMGLAAERATYRSRDLEEPSNTSAQRGAKDLLRVRRASATEAKRVTCWWVHR